jgi:hypothetical protein
VRALAVALLAVTLSACPPVRVVSGEVVPREQLAGTLEAAEAAFARRPDAAEVRRAVTGFQSVARSDPAGLEGPEGVIRSVAWLLEHGVREDRESLVATMLAAGELCQARAPRSGRCDYWQAVARGLGAREHPATGLTELQPILELLRRAQAAAPALEEGGPSRALALLLLRAPGWPVGPGDPELAVAEARKGVALAPTHPQNHLVLAEALAATGDDAGARAARVEALRVAGRRAGAGDPDGAGWMAEAAAALQRE